MKVAIAGYGVEGEANYRYWQKLGHDVTIVDEKSKPGKQIPKGAQVLLGEKVFQKLQDFDLVVRTASLPPHHIATDGEVWSSTNEFFAKCPAPIIGVTGTKGKGTTSSLIASILRAAGHNVFLVGNIGTAPLSVLKDITPNDIVVFELSSFQLWDLKRSPHVAVVLMIEPDHLDIHADFNDYIKAKSNIRRHQKSGDVCFYHPRNKFSEKIAKSSVLGDTQKYAHKDGSSVYVNDDAFYVGDEKICNTAVMSIRGEHNLENACAAISAARVFTVDTIAIERGLHEFTGLPHRLKHVATVNDVEYFDDSIATTAGSAVAAVNAFTAPKVLILGGTDKGVEYDALARSLAECKSLRSIILIGSNAEKIHESLKKAGVVAGVNVKGMISMHDVVKTAHHIAQKGDVVILSPASASFDQYTSYADRGEQFIKAVEAL